MTRINYAKPTGVLTPSRPSQPSPDTWMIPGIHHPLSSFGRLQGFSQIPTPADNTGASSGSIPFSAMIVRRDKHASTRAAPRPQVFATSRQRRRPQRLAGLFHPAGTRRVLVFRVSPTIDRELFPVHPAPSLLPTLHGFLPVETDACLASDRSGVTLMRSWFPQAPCPASGTGFHLGLRPTLKLYSRS